MSVRAEWVSGDDFVQLAPALVEALDGNVTAAYVLARVRFRSRVFGYDHDGRRWWRMSIADLADDLRITPKRVRVALTQLVAAGALTSAKHHAQGVSDHTLSYAILYETDGISDMPSGANQGTSDVPSGANDDVPHRANHHVPSGANLPYNKVEEEEEETSSSELTRSDASTVSPAAVDEQQRVVEQLCTLLADRVEQNGARRPTITKRWRDAARLMLTRDGRDAEQIARAIEWAQADEFWRANVLSMPKLREKYDQLRLQAARRQRVGRRTTDDRVLEGLALAQQLTEREQIGEGR